MNTLHTTPLTLFLLSIGLATVPACDHLGDPSAGDAAAETIVDPETDFGDEDEDPGTEVGNGEGDDDPDDDQDDDQDGDDESGDDDSGDGDSGNGGNAGDEVGDDEGDDEDDGEFTPPEADELPPIGWCADANGFVADTCGTLEEPCDAAFEEQCAQSGTIFIPGNEESDVIPCEDINPLLADCDEEFIGACFGAGGLFQIIELDGDGTIGEGQCWFPDGIG